MAIQYKYISTGNKVCGFKTIAIKEPDLGI